MKARTFGSVVTFALVTSWCWSGWANETTAAPARASKALSFVREAGKRHADHVERLQRRLAGRERRSAKFTVKWQRMSKARGELETQKEVTRRDLGLKPTESHRAERLINQLLPLYDAKIRHLEMAISFAEKGMRRDNERLRDAKAEAEQAPIDALSNALQAVEARASRGPGEDRVRLSPASRGVPEGADIIDVYNGEGATVVGDARELVGPLWKVSRIDLNLAFQVIDRAVGQKAGREVRNELRGTVEELLENTAVLQSTLERALTGRTPFGALPLAETRLENLRKATASLVPSHAEPEPSGPPQQPSVAKEPSWPLLYGRIATRLASHAAGRPRPEVEATAVTDFRVGRPTSVSEAGAANALEFDTLSPPQDMSGLLRLGQTWRGIRGQIRSNPETLPKDLEPVVRAGNAVIPIASATFGLNEVHAMLTDVLSKIPD